MKILYLTEFFYTDMSEASATNNCETEKHLSVFADPTLSRQSQHCWQQNDGWMHGTQIPSILTKKWTAVNHRERYCWEDGEGPPPLSGGWGRWGHWCPPHIPRWLRSGSSWKLTYGPCMYTSICMYLHSWEGDTVGDYIQRSLETGVWSPRTLMNAMVAGTSGMGVETCAGWIETHQVGQIILGQI